MSTKGDLTHLSKHHKTMSMHDFQSALQESVASKLTEALNSIGMSDKEQEGFTTLYDRFLKERKNVIDWDKIQLVNDETVIPYSSLEECAEEETKELLSKLVVVKLNGGLGTTMGCHGPKSAIEVRNDMTFLDLTVRQIEYLNDTYQVDVPLVLMNSFNTQAETEKILRKYDNHNVEVHYFQQSKYPRISKDTLLPIALDEPEDKNGWYPPGHGDFYTSFYNSGLMESFARQGKEFVFLANVDNLGATVDLDILKHFADNKLEFMMEVTDKTRADVKGGTLIEYEGRVKLLEVAQVPAENVRERRGCGRGEERELILIQCCEIVGRVQIDQKVQDFQHQQLVD
eukprot:TRINITY_DN5054_c0_g1_i3.p1 TRINITY_DN5054_c0_g1~~TRINITY_DN5054_c0_g1_i3.p1  ORF type:complete len:379 (+),score=91.85 TRINITY_DN5054_c0_g1_i3:110-1138(+)